MDTKEIVLKANKVNKKKRNIKIVKLVLLFLSLFLLLIYVVLSVIYNRGNFTISLDKNLYYEKNLIIYETPTYKVYRSELYAEAVDSMDNFSEKWLPDNLTSYEGSHNGDNYIAYSFYIENIGEQTSDYYSEIIIDDVIKNVDDAVRIRVYKDDEYVTYAKGASNGGTEKDTVAFVSDTLVARDHVQNFGPKSVTKYTIVTWLEGNDPECTDNIIGGEIKLHMEFNSEFIDK